MFQNMMIYILKQFEKKIVSQLYLFIDDHEIDLMIIIKKFLILKKIMLFFLNKEDVIDQNFIEKIF
jgi:hypothetical protein